MYRKIGKIQNKRLKNRWALFPQPSAFVWRHPQSCHCKNEGGYISKLLLLTCIANHKGWVGSSWTPPSLNDQGHWCTYSVLKDCLWDCGVLVKEQVKDLLHKKQMAAHSEIHALLSHIMASPSLLVSVVFVVEVRLRWLFPMLVPVAMIVIHNLAIFVEVAVWDGWPNRYWSSNWQYCSLSLLHVHRLCPG